MTAKQLLEQKETNENHARIVRAHKALRLYHVEEEGEYAVIDLLADLLHYCEKRGINFDSRLAVSRRHFNTENKD